MAFWLGLLSIPTAAIGIAALIRFFEKAPQTAAADVMCGTFVFDAIVRGNSGDFAKFAPWTSSAVIEQCAMLSFFLAICGWAFALFKVEPKLISSHFSAPGPDHIAFPLPGWLACWAACFALVFAHVVFF